MVNITKYTLPLMAGAALMLSSCADDPVKDIKVNPPSSLTDKVDYTSFKNLKDAASSSVKISGAMKSEDLVKGGVAKIIAVNNFDEVSASDFNYKSFVKDDGSLSFSSFKDFVRVAENSNMTVYGPALASNTNLNATYLKSILKGPVEYYKEDSTYTVEPSADNYIFKDVQADLIDNGDLSDMANTLNFVKKENRGDIVNAEITAGIGKDGKNGIKVSSAKKVSDPWDTQFWIKYNAVVEKGAKFTVSFDYKASAEAKVSSQGHKDPGSYLNQDGVGDLQFTTDWQTITKEVTPSGDGLLSMAFNLNELEDAADYFFCNFKVTGTVKEKSINYDQVNNGNADGDAKLTNAIAKIAPSTDTDVKAPIEDKVGVDGSKCYVIKTPKKEKETWDTQFWIVSRNPLKKGNKIRLKYDYKASVACKATTGEHAAPGAWLAGGDPVDFTTEWQTFEKVIEVKTDNAQSWAFDLSQESGEVTFYFDNISLVCEEVELQSGTFTKPVTKEKETPLTAEQKADTVNWALRNYIKGAMEATAGKVAAWDVVKDPLATTGDFMWQDYIGADNYVVAATKAAKETFKGDAAALKQFIAISDAQNASNVSKVTAKIAAWEKAGAIIDGIHAIITLDVEASTSDIDAMLSALAKSGKLVKITIANISADEENTSIDQLGKTDKKNLAAAINYLAVQYGKVIESGKQYGIAVENINSTIWTSEFARNEVYKGLSLGLSGETYEK